MDHFHYRHGQLHAEDVALSDIAATVGTPFYCYSAATLTRHYQLFTAALAPIPHMVCFAIKSLSNLAVLKLLGDLGAGMDVVSIGEYHRARAAGVPGSRIVFSGVGKTRDEMRIALQGGIRQFNVESEPELRALSQVATALGVIAPIALRDAPDQTLAQSSITSTTARIHPIDPVLPLLKEELTTDMKIIRRAKSGPQPAGSETTFHRQVTRRYHPLALGATK